MDPSVEAGLHLRTTALPDTEYGLLWRNVALGFFAVALRLMSSYEWKDTNISAKPSSETGATPYKMKFFADCLRTRGRYGYGSLWSARILGTKRFNHGGVLISDICSAESREARNIPNTV